MRHYRHCKWLVGLWLASSPFLGAADPVKDAEVIRHAGAMWSMNKATLENKTISDTAFKNCHTLGGAVRVLEAASQKEDGLAQPSGVTFKTEGKMEKRAFHPPTEFPAKDISLLRMLRWISMANDCDARLAPEGVEVIARQPNPSRDLLTRPSAEEQNIESRRRRLETTLLPFFEVENITFSQALVLLQRAVDQADVAAGRKPQPLNLVFINPAAISVNEGASISLAVKDVSAREVLQYCGDLAQCEANILPEVLECVPISTKCGGSGSCEFMLAKAPVERLLANPRRSSPPTGRLAMSGSYDRSTGVLKIGTTGISDLLVMENFLWCLGALDMRSDSRPWLRQKLPPITGKTMLAELRLKATTLGQALVEVEKLAAAAGTKLRLAVKGAKPVESDISVDWREVSLETVLYYLARMSACDVTSSGSEVLFLPLGE